jgi:hypothetical protein
MSTPEVKKENRRLVRNVLDQAKNTQKLFLKMSCILHGFFLNLEKKGGNGANKMLSSAQAFTHEERDAHLGVGAAHHPRHAARAEVGGVRRPGSAHLPVPVRRAEFKREQQPAPDWCKLKIKKRKR